MPSSNAETVQNLPKNLQEKIEKTGAVFLVANILSLGVAALFLDTKFCFLALVVSNASLIYHLHEIGKSNRVGSNLIVNMASFFASSRLANEIKEENAIRNVINGGAAIYDEVVANSSRDLQRR